MKLTQDNTYNPSDADAKEKEQTTTETPVEEDEDDVWSNNVKGSGKSTKEATNELADKIINKNGSASKKIIIGIAILLIIVVVVIVVLFLKGGKNNASSRLDTLLDDNDAGLVIDSDTPVVNVPTSEDGGFVIDTPTTPNTTVTETGGTTEPTVWTEKVLRDLRAVGYTGADIEKMQKNLEDPYAMYKKALDDRFDKEREIQKAYQDSESPEYRKLKRLTYLGERPAYKAPSLDQQVRYISYTQFKTTYEKVPARGSVLYLKVKLPEKDGNAFVPVSYAIYAGITDKGTISVDIQYSVTNTDRFVDTVIITKESF